MAGKDYTTEIFELQNARGVMQDAKKLIKSQVQREYKIKAEAEIAEKSAEAEYAFALKLKAAADAGVPQGLLRTQVLRTNTWSIWEYWRDLAEIEPERISARNAKIKESSWYSWNEDFSVLTVFKTPEGVAILRPFLCDRFEWDTKGGFSCYFSGVQESSSNRDQWKPYYEQANEIWGEKTYGVLFKIVEPVVLEAIAEGHPVPFTDHRK